MAPDRILKRFFPAITLLLIAFVAYLQAHGAVRLLALALGGSFARVSSLPPRQDAEPPVPSAPKSGQAIVDRNPFDAVTGPFQRDPGSERGLAPPTDASDPLSWPSCQDVEVVILTESSSDPWWSLATLQGPSEPRPRLRRVGDGFANKQVAFIGYNPKQQAPAVWLQGTGTLCQAMLFRGRPEPANVAPTRPQPSPNAPASSMATLRSLRVVPEQKDGRLGLRLFGIRPTSLLSTLGLKNGDRLESINGLNIASPEKALEAYARLRTAQHLRLRLERAGRPLEIDLNII
jgi:general secretion pathway protein C